MYLLTALFVGFWISTVDPVVNEQLSMTVSPMLYDVLEPPGDTLAPSTKTSNVPSLFVSEPVMTLMQNTSAKGSTHAMDTSFSATIARAGLCWAGQWHRARHTRTSM